MDNNQLHTISSTVLTPLTSLQLLRMSGNRITSISDNAFTQLKQLSTMYGTNRYHVYHCCCYSLQISFKQPDSRNYGKDVQWSQHPSGIVRKSKNVERKKEKFNDPDVI